MADTGALLFLLLHVLKPTLKSIAVASRMHGLKSLRENLAFRMSRWRVARDGVVGRFALCLVCAAVWGAAPTALDRHDGCQPSPSGLGYV